MSGRKPVVGAEKYVDPRFAELAERWADALLDDNRPQLRTALRFDTPRFHPFILPERVDRIARLHRSDRGLTDERRRRSGKEAALELEMSHNAALDDDWTHRQLAVAEYLDGLSEMSSRLEIIRLRESARFEDSQAAARRCPDRMRSPESTCYRPRKIASNNRRYRFGVELDAHIADACDLDVSSNCKRVGCAERAGALLLLTDRI